MKLSILIPTVPERSKQVDSLVDYLDQFIEGVKVTQGYNFPNGCYAIHTSYIGGEVEIFVVNDDKTLTLGEKRQFMYEIASGEYSLMIDDDDLIAEDAIHLILAAIEQKPDCITFQERVQINGVESKSNFSHEYEKWEGDGNQILSDGFHYHRTVFYKCVVKTQIARSVPFPPIRWNEDEQWAAALKPHLHNEIHIDKELYYYIHNSTPQEHNTRYGFDKE